MSEHACCSGEVPLQLHQRHWHMCAYCRPYRAVVIRALRCPQSWRSSLAHHTQKAYCKVCGPICLSACHDCFVVMAGGFWQLSDKGQTTVRLVACWQAPRITAIFWPNGKGEVSGVLFSTRQNLQNMTDGTLTVREALARVDASLPQVWIEQIAAQFTVRDRAPTCNRCTLANVMAIEFA